MQDRSPPARRNHLQRTAGPYIGSSGVIESQLYPVVEHDGAFNIIKLT